MALFGFTEAVEFAKQSKDPHVQAMGRMLVDQKSRLARQHEYVVKLEKYIETLRQRLHKVEIRNP